MFAHFMTSECRPCDGKQAHPIADSPIAIVPKDVGWLQDVEAAPLHGVRDRDVPIHYYMKMESGAGAFRRGRY